MKQESLMAVVLAACAVAGFFTYRMITAPPTPAPQTSLPAFVLTTTEGERRDITEYLGKPMVLNFWATWCPPCLREMPLLVDLHTRHGEEIQVVGVAIDRMESVLEFMEKLAVDYPVLVGEQDAMEAAGLFGDAFIGLPFTVFVGAAGDVLGVHTGEIHAPDMPPIEATLLALAQGDISLDQAQRRLADLDAAGT
jgi:thiol-disulfide isomerase/thioredoxin